MGLWAVEVRGRDLAGRTIRTGPGAWRESSSTATECPDFGVYLTGKPPLTLDGSFGGSIGRTSACPAQPPRLSQLCVRLINAQRVSGLKFACGGGTGRTGTALALLAVLSGLPAERTCHGFGSITDAGRSKHRGSAVGSSTLQWQSGAIFTEGPSTATPRSGRHKGNAERDRLVDPANTAPEETLAVSQYGPCETDRIKTDH
jgi:hypothetical protein